MKVVYANPVFLDYRLPFYKELNRLFKGEFHIIYSRERYRILKRNDLYERIKKEMGNNAHPLLTDYLFDTHSMSFHMKDIEKGRHIPFTFGLIRTIHRLRPEVLITEGFFQWTPLVILYSIFFHVPVYMGYERTLHTERNTGRLKTLHRRLTDKFIKGYLVNGSETKKYLESIGIKSEKIYIGGMSADSSGLQAGLKSMKHEEIEMLQRKLGISVRGVVYLFVGKITYRKGIALLLKVWRIHVNKYPYDKLIVVGSGSEYENLSIKYRMESVVFTGGVPYNIIYKYYSVADVFILPTVEDNWSLVIPEAMACGLPVATSIYNGCYPELIKEGENGCVFNPFDDNSMLRALSYFHKVNLKAQGEASKCIEKNFDTEHCALRVFNVLNNER